MHDPRYEQYQESSSSPAPEEESKPKPKGRWQKLLGRSALLMGLIVLVYSFQSSQQEIKTSLVDALISQEPSLTASDPVIRIAGGNPCEGQQNPTPCSEDGYFGPSRTAAIDAVAPIAYDANDNLIVSSMNQVHVVQGDGSLLPHIDTYTSGIPLTGGQQIGAGMLVPFSGNGNTPLSGIVGVGEIFSSPTIEIATPLLMEVGVEGAIFFTHPTATGGEALYAIYPSTQFTGHSQELGLVIDNMNGNDILSIDGIEPLSGRQIMLSLTYDDGGTTNGGIYVDQYTSGTGGFTSFTELSVVYPGSISPPNFSAGDVYGDIAWDSSQSDLYIVIERASSEKVEILHRDDSVTPVTRVTGGSTVGLNVVTSASTISTIQSGASVTSANVYLKTPTNIAIKPDTGGGNNGLFVITKGRMTAPSAEREGQYFFMINTTASDYQAPNYMIKNPHRNDIPTDRIGGTGVTPGSLASEIATRPGFSNPNSANPYNLPAGNMAAIAYIEDTVMGQFLGDISVDSNGKPSVVTIPETGTPTVLSFQLQNIIDVLVPSPPQAPLTGVEAGPYQIDLTWAKASDAGSAGGTERYEVKYGTSAITTEQEYGNAAQVLYHTVTPGAATETANVGGLTPNTTYYFGVRSLDSANQSPTFLSVGPITTPPPRGGIEVGITATGGTAFPFPDNIRDNLSFAVYQTSTDPSTSGAINDFIGSLTYTQMRELDALEVGRYRMQINTSGMNLHHLNFDGANGQESAGSPLAVITEIPVYENQLTLTTNAVNPNGAFAYEFLWDKGIDIDFTLNGGITDSALLAVDLTAIGSSTVATQPVSITYADDASLDFSTPNQPAFDITNIPSLATDITIDNLPPTIIISNLSTPVFTETSPSSGTWQAAISVFTVSPVDVDIILEPRSGSNNPPTAVISSPTQGVIHQRNQPITLDGSTSSDPDLDSLTYAWLTTANGSFGPAGENAAVTTFTPTSAGTYALQLDVNDGLASDTDNFNITVTASNPPIVEAGEFLDVEPFTTMFLGDAARPYVTTPASFHNPENGSGEIMRPTWTVLQAPSGSTAAVTAESTAITQVTPFTSNGRFRPDVSGEYVLEVSVTDEISPGNNLLFTRTDTTTLWANEPPTVGMSVAKIWWNQGETVAINGSVNDDLDPDIAITVTWEFITIPPGATIANPPDGEDTSVTWAIDQAPGNYLLQMTATDTRGASSTALRDFDINDPPIAVASGCVTARYNQSCLLDASASSDTDGTVSGYSWEVLSAPVGSALVGATLSGVSPSLTPDAEGDFTLRLTVTDNYGATGQTNITLTVQTNAAPTAVADPAVTNDPVYQVAWNSGTGILLDVLANDIDTDPGDALSIFEISDAPSRGTAVIESGQIRYTPSGGSQQPGPDVFEYRIQDDASNGGIIKQSAPVSVTVSLTNQPPVAVNDVYNITAGQQLVADGAQAPTLLQNDTDPEGVPAHMVVTNTPLPQVVQQGTITPAGLLLSLNPNGTFSYLPGAFNGVATFDYEVTDSLFGSSTATVTINVGSAAPTATNDDLTGITIIEDNGPVLIPVSQVLANDTNPQQDQLQVTSVTVTHPLSQPIASSAVVLDNGTPANYADDSIEFTMNPDANGPRTLVYQVANSSGTDQAEASITIIPVHDAPRVFRASTPTNPLSGANVVVAPEGTVSNAVLSIVTERVNTAVPVNIQSSSVQFSPIDILIGSSLVPDVSTWDIRIEPELDKNLPPGSVVTATVTVTDETGLGGQEVAPGSGVFHEDTSTFVFEVEVPGVNDAPQFTVGAVPSVQEGIATFSIPISDIYSGPATATDERASQNLDLSVTAISGADVLSNLDVTPPVFLPGDPTREATITFNAPSKGGAVTLGLTVQDDGPITGGSVNTLSQQISFTVEGVNDIPQLTHPVSITINEDEPMPSLRSIALTSISPGPASATDEINQVLAISARDLDTPIADLLTNITGSPIVGFSSNLQLELTPNANGQTTVEVTLEETNSQGQLPANLSQVFSIPLIITPINDPPTFTLSGTTAIYDTAPEQTVEVQNLSVGPANEGAQVADISVLSVTPPGVITAPTITGQNINFSPIPGQTGTVTISVQVQDDGGTGNGGQNSAVENFVVAITEQPNIAPITTTTNSVPVQKGSTINIIGTYFDGDSDAMSFAEWQMISRPAGSTVTLASTDQLATSFIPDESGDYEFSFIVNDGRVSSAPSTLSVTVPNAPPVANAGANQPGQIKNNVITLDASSSTDPDDAILYSWTQTSGPAVVLSNSTVAQPAFTSAESGTLVFELTVSDDDVNNPLSSTALVTVEVNNQPPVAEAGDTLINQAKNTAIVLNGSASSDPDTSDTLTYSWRQISGPAGNLSNTNQAIATLEAPHSGLYDLELTVTDSDASNPSQSTDVVTMSIINQSPVANAGANQVQRVGTPVVLSAGASSDPDSDPLTYLWTQIDGPTVTVANASAQQIAFTPLEETTYRFQLEVDDQDASNPLSSRDVVEIIVTASGAAPAGGIISNLPTAQQVREEPNALNHPVFNPEPQRWSLLDALMNFVNQVIGPTP